MSLGFDLSNNLRRRDTLKLWTLSGATAHNNAALFEVPSPGNTRFQGNSHADGFQHAPEFHPLWQRKANDIYKTTKTTKPNRKKKSISAFLNCNI